MTVVTSIADLIERARAVRVEDIIRERGIGLRGRIDRWGPCPVCGGGDRFSINIRKQLFNCRGCGVGGDVIALEQFISGSDFRTAIATLAGERIVEPRQVQPAVVARRNNDADRTAAAFDLWRASTDPRVPIVEKYLTRRKLELDAVAGEVIRWNERIGAMVALFRNIATDQPQAVSRTYLDTEGQKLERKFLGPVGGAAIKLDPDDAVLGGLHVAEGVETALTARQLGLRPTWALGSAGAIAAFPVLSGIECLTLLAEHDDASQRAVETCAARWHAAGREVLINEPIGGKDLNDAIRGAT